MANNIDTKEAFESRVSELLQENELLLVQLHHAQEELERNYSEARTVDSKPTVDSKSGGANAYAIANGWVADELSAMHAENHRLQALVEVQKRIHDCESNCALNARLGNILISGVDAPRSLLSVPGKLIRIWHQSTRRTAPKALGGTDFNRVISAWQSGGFDTVERVMGAQFIAPAVQAQGYTALARHLGKGDRANAAKAARRAYDLDPKAFRLKWLAFRLHEAGDVVEAEAMLELLPIDTQFSESEARQAKQLRHEAKGARDNEAKQKTAFVERRAAADKQLSSIARERDQQSKLAADRASEVATIKQSKAKLEQEKAMLLARHESQTRLLSECKRELEALKHAKSQLLKENAVLVAQFDRSETELRNARDSSIQRNRDNELLVADLHRIQGELEQVLVDRESLRSANAQREIQARDAADRVREIEALNQAVADLEHDKQALEFRHERQRELVEDRVRELEALKQAKSIVEQEKQALAVRHEVELRIAEERHRELEGLRQTKTLLEQEKQSLAVKHEVQSSVVVECAKELDALKRATMQLEQEKHSLREACDAQSRLAEERKVEMDVLKQAKTKLEQEKQSLREAQSRLVEERKVEMEALKQVKTKLEQEKIALKEKHDSQVKVTEEQNVELLAAKQAQKNLELKNAALQEDRDAQQKIAEERCQQVTALKEEKAGFELQKSLLEKQKRASVGGENRGDADIEDLIADLELFFNGKAIIYVDVGAYMGNVFLKFNRSIEKFKIHEAHLFEPNPVSYQQLLKKTAGMDKPIVHTYNLAVSETSETDRFIPAKTMTKAIVPEMDSANVSGDVFTARCISLDKQSSIFTDGKVNLLKIDVEGRELDVLRSARQLLASQNVDILYIEVGFNRTGTQQTYFAEIDQFLQGFGYRVLRIYEQKEEWMSDSPLLRRANIAYMSEKFANAHPLKLMQEIRELKERINQLSLSAPELKNAQ